MKQMSKFYVAILLFWQIYQSYNTMQSNRTYFQSPTRRQTVINHHCDYKATSSLSQASKNTQSMLSRIRSHHNLRHNLLNSHQTISESKYSPSSWKRFIRREYQSNIDHKDRIFKGSARDEARQILNRRYRLPLNGPKYIQNFEKVQLRATQYDTTHSKDIRNISGMLYSSSYQKNNINFKEISNCSFDQNWLDPQKRQSCITKETEEMNSCTQMGIFTQRQLQNAYRYSLLEQECAFLRKKFLQHYVRNHHDKQCPK